MKKVGKESREKLVFHKLHYSLISFIKQLERYNVQYRVQFLKLIRRVFLRVLLRMVACTVYILQENI